MSKEAMKLALEALQWFTAAEPWDEPDVSKAIKALEEALAKQEQGEPVAWFWFDERDGGEWLHIADSQVNADKFGNVKVIPLYTTPQQRTWVGLTDDEFEDIEMSFTPTNKIDAMLAVEAKLKEKNT